MYTHNAVARAIKAERSAEQCFAIGDFEGQRKFNRIAERAWRLAADNPTTKTAFGLDKWD